MGRRYLPHTSVWGWQCASHALSYAAVLSVFAAVAGLIARPAEAGVTITETDYTGWHEAYRMTNGEVEVVVVPAVARIMRYAYIGGPNILWNNPVPAGKPARPDDWPNFGGEKAWPWPQDDWADRIGHVWPPPPEADQVPYRANVIGADTVQIESPVLTGFGLRIVRDITLASRGTRVTIVTKLIQINAADPKAPPVAAWTIAQVPAAAGKVYVGLLSGSPLKDGWKSLSSSSFSSITVHDSILSATHASTHDAKIGIDADRLGAVVGKDTLFTIQATSADHGEYTPGERAQIYVSSAPSATDAARGITAYFELETTAPKIPLTTPGQISTLTNTWELHKLKPGEDPAKRLHR